MPGKNKVQQDQRIKTQTILFDGLLAAGASGRAVSTGREHVGEQRERRGIVFDDEDFHAERKWG